LERRRLIACENLLFVHYTSICKKKQLSALPVVVEKDQKIQKFEKQLLDFLVLYL